MKTRKGARGIAMLSVVLAMLVIVPLAMIVVQKTVVMNRAFWLNRANAAARRTADNLAMEFMSQFSKGNSYYEDHFSVTDLQRTKTFFESGFASVNITTNTNARTVQITAKGEYGINPLAPKSTKSLQALFYFVPLIGQYVQQGVFHGYTIANLVVNGPVRMDDTVLVNAANVTFNDVVIANNINVRNDTVFNSQVFYGNSFTAGATYAGGPPINGIPPGGFFRIDQAFYRVNSTTQSLNINTSWDFAVNANVPQYRSRYDFNNDYVFGAGEGWGAWTNIPANGGIFYVENAKTYLSGTVGARVTIVCSAPPANGLVTLNNMGIIAVTDDFGYPVILPNPQAFANSTQSLFVIAAYGFVFSLPAARPVGSTLRISGAYAVTDPAYDDLGCNGPGHNVTISHLGVNPPSPDFFNFLGSWNNMGLCNRFVPNPPVLNFDPNLQRFPSPGVPERPVLVNWRRR
ncbi:MAG: hypothetical protein IPN90_05220 [Elusimicrobia bacterium]|nr:hypothetical protein [Elusimicrobiota bacterium]